MTPKLSKKVSIPKRTLYESPMVISLKKNYTGSHIVLHRTKTGCYSYKVFWIDYKHEVKYPPREVVATAVKDYKRKNDCILAIKEVCDAFPSIMSHIPCFECKNGVIQTIDTKIKVEVKRYF